MSKYSPTLRMELTSREVAEIEGSGTTVAQIESDLSAMFDQRDFAHGNIQFAAQEIREIESGHVLGEYKAQVAAVFTLDGVRHVQTVSGEVIAIKFHLV